MRRCPRCTAADRLRAACLVVAAIVWPPSRAWAAPTFEEDVLPVFREKCCGCHNADKQAGGLDLTSYARALAGGSSGEVIKAGDPDGSHLWQVASHEAEPKMPPESDRIPKPMLDVLRGWIAGGAVERKGGVAAVKKPPVSLAIDPQAVTIESGPPIVPPRMSLEVATHAPRPLAITALAASPNGAVAAVGGRGQVLLYDTGTLELRGVLPFPAGDVKTVRFSRNAKLLLAGGGAAARSGRVMLWDVATAAPLTELGDEFDEVLAADVSADQRLVALGGPHRVVRLLRTADGGVEGEIRRHTDWITAVEFAPNGRLLATGDRAGNAFLWETGGFQEEAVLKGHAGGITAVAWRGDANAVATASEDGKVRLWNPRSGEKTKEWDAHAGGVQGLCWLADGRIASCGRDRKVVVWKGDGGRDRDFPEVGDIALRLAVTGDRRLLLAGDLAGGLTAFALDTAAVVGRPDTNPAPLATRLRAAEAARDQLATLEPAVTDKAGAAAAGLQQAQARLAEAEQALAAARQAAADATKARDAAAADVDAMKARQAEAAKVVDRWKDEIEFAKRPRP